MGLEKLERWNVGYVLASAFSIFPVALWLATPGAVHIYVASDIWLVFGIIAALIGVVLFSLSFLLATRAKWVEALFGGLDKAYKAHHIFGGLAFCFLLFHPILLSLQYVSFSVKAAAEFLLPPLSNIPQWYGVLALVTMIVFLVITFYFFRSVRYQRWKLIHQLLGISLMLGTLHAFYIPSQVFVTSPFLRIYILFFLVLGLISFLYRVLFGAWLVHRLPYTVSAVRPQAGNVSEIALSPLKKPLTFNAGQFIFISFKAKEISPEWHPFSISSASTSSELTISVKALGDYTSQIAHLVPGTNAVVEGPYGRFSYQNFSKEQIWIAGGIGITPFLSMARSLTLSSNVVATLFYTVRTKVDAAYLEELKALATPEKGLTLILISTDHDAILTAEHVVAVCGPLLAKDILLCGPLTMMSSLKQQFQDLGVDRHRIRYEQFSMQ
jgi:predicted ferric reductase